MRKTVCDGIVFGRDMPESDLCIVSLFHVPNGLVNVKEQVQVLRRLIRLIAETVTLS